MNINPILVVPTQGKISKNQLIWQKIMPYLLILSFAFSGFYNVIFLANDTGSFSGIMGTVQTMLDLVVYSLIFGIVSWLFFEFLLMIFHFVSSFNLYIKFIPKTVINTRFRFWFMLRNIVLGIIGLLFMLAPYMFAYIAVITLVLDFVVVFCMYFDLRYKFFDDAIAPFIFNGIMIPLILYEILIFAWL
ncbi:MAG: hypothetical protein RR334_01430 [Clostridia bacterium]